LADFRPIAAKYSDSFLSIIARLYTQPLSITSSNQSPKKILTPERVKTNYGLLGSGSLLKSTWLRLA
jgi:hypothetical protein